MKKEDYVLTDYAQDVVEYDEEIDGAMFPDRDEHLKKKEEAKEKITKLKQNLRNNLGRVRR